MANTIFTIGHSNHQPEKFFKLLSDHGITAVADVRSQPFSRFSPHFNRDLLQAELRRRGLAYVFLGKELGARSEDQTCYVNGQVQFDRLAQTALFREGLARVIQGLSSFRIALMCAEKDPLNCHRAILVCRELEKRGIQVSHILEDGQLETHEEAIGRLLAEYDMAEKDLFRNRDEAVREAYEKRARQIGYTQNDVGGLTGRFPA